MSTTPETHDTLSLPQSIRMFAIDAAIRLDSSLPPIYYADEIADFVLEGTLPTFEDDDRDPQVEQVP